MANYKRINITLPDELHKKFIKYCNKEGMHISSRIAVLIKKDLLSFLEYNSEEIIDGLSSQHQTKPKTFKRKKFE